LVVFALRHNGVHVFRTFVAAEQAKKLGLEAIPFSMFTSKYLKPPALILGFAGCNPAELRRGVSVLATALRSR
jgi:GntR family transcriptional regulator / MocR family aminotransferase